jgi:hypothetical protein
MAIRKSININHEVNDVYEVYLRMLQYRGQLSGLQAQFAISL